MEITSLNLSFCVNFQLLFLDLDSAWFENTGSIISGCESPPTSYILARFSKLFKSHLHWGKWH